MPDISARAAIAAAKLAALRESYREGLPQRLEEILAAWRHYDDAPSPEGLLAMRRLVHKLAGTAGLFGLRELGQHAMALELLLDHTMRATPPARPAVECQVNQQLAALCRVAEAALLATGEAPS